MKILLSIVFITSAILVSLFFTSKQYKGGTTPFCKGIDQSCFFDGIKTLRENKVSYITALATAQDLESRRNELTNKYNSVSDEDRTRLEALLPNNADNIKLILELEAIAKKRGILIESPKLQNEIVISKSITGQDLRGDVASDPNGALPYGTFSFDFTVRTNYENMKTLISDIEKNLRLIEIVSISIKVPEVNPKDFAKLKLYPDGTYDVNLKGVIYYLKN